MKQFKDLTIMGQKMRIVRDAISQIKNGRIKIDTGSYFNVDDDTFDRWTDSGSRDLQSYLLQDKPNLCECCAKGALFASCVIITDKVSISDNYADEQFQKSKLKKWFGPLELDMIEAAFERKVFNDSANRLEDGYGDYTLLALTCIRFGRNYKNKKKRLLAILENILKNGSFKP
jgi:hypothetical protein